MLCLFPLLIGRSCAALLYFSPPPPTPFTLGNIVRPANQQGKQTIHPDGPGQTQLAYYARMLWEIFSVTASVYWQLVCALYPAVDEVGVCSRELTSTFSRLCHHADVTKQQLEEELKQLDAELHRLQEVASSAKTLRWGVCLALCVCMF